MHRTCLIAALPAALALGSCSQAPEAIPPLSAMRLLDPDLVLGDLQGQLHLRVFARGALRCEPATGHVLDGMGNRVLHGPEVDPVTPAVRCSPAFRPSGSNTATPVDECFDKSAPHTVNVPGSGTFIVLVHGQGNIPLPTGGTQSGILGAGCTEVPLAPGHSESVTVALHEQRPMGVCGDGVLDFDETCDLGAAMNNGTSGCAANCQTVEQTVNTHAEANHRHPAVIWPTGQRLVVAWEVADAPAASTLVEHIYGRYYTAQGVPETNPAALAVDIDLSAGPGPKTAVSLCPTADGFVGAWNTLEYGSTSSTYEVAAQAYTFDIPRDAHGQFSPGTDRQQDPSIAASSTRVVAVWRVGNPSTGLRVGSVPRATPLTFPTSTASLTTDAADQARVAALSDGSFTVVWTAADRIFARHLDAMGVPQGMATRVSDSTAGAEDQPAITGLPDGTAVVAWHDTSMNPGDTSGSAIRWRIVDGTGNPTGATHVAETTTDGDQQHPTVAAGGSPATILFAWEDVNTHHVRGRLRHPDDGEAFSRITGATADFQISTGNAGGGPRVLPAAAYGGPNGSSFAVTWEDDTTGTSIHLRTFPL